jgi:hypothetical protein
MRKLLVLVAAGTFAMASAASAGTGDVTANLSVTIGTLPPAGFSGGSSSASSAGAGGAATLPAGAINGVFQTAINPPLLGILDGIGVAVPGLAINSAFGTPAAAVNDPLAWGGTTGTMALNASAYLLMAGTIVAEVPLGVVGVGGTQMFHVLSLVSGTINANPYQLGAVTLMGSLNMANHTLMGTGADNRTANGNGTLVLVSPTTVSLGALGALASISTLTLTYSNVPEPNAALLAGAAVAGLVGLAGWRKRRA